MLVSTYMEGQTRSRGYITVKVRVRVRHSHKLIVRACFRNRFRVWVTVGVRIMVTVTPRLNVI